MSGLEIFLGITLGLIVNETCDLSPWAAKKLVQWSARMRYTDPERTETRATELVSVIEERPGKLFKLCTALGFTGAAILIIAHCFLSKKVQAIIKTTQRILWKRLITKRSKLDGRVVLKITEPLLEGFKTKEVNAAVDRGDVNLEFADNALLITFDERNISQEQVIDWVMRVRLNEPP